LPTLKQLCNKIRKPKLRKTKAKYLNKCPQRRGICIRVYTMKPKKPNSATRKITKVFLSTRKYITVYIPGIGHNLQQHSVILIRGGRVKDLPGIHYHALRGKLDFNFRETFIRKQSRSKYSIKKNSYSF